MVEFADYDLKAKGQGKDESKRTASILFGNAADFRAYPSRRRGRECRQPGPR